jgi:hypothetical protein
MANEILTIPERVAVLETKVANVETLLERIDTKMDELIQLKAKGMGAVSFATLIIGSGFIGIIFTVWNMLKGPHL